MKTIYIDSDFKCHVSNTDGFYTEIETDVFDGKCSAYIECYRFIPKGYSWTREDGEVFEGEMVSPHKDTIEIENIQALYEELQTTEIAPLKEENAMLLECILEMSEVIYA